MSRSSGRLLVVVVIGAAVGHLAAACARKERASGAPGGERAPGARSPVEAGEPLAAELGRDREATLAALALAYRHVNRALGAHEVQCRATLTRTVAGAQATVEQTASARVDARGAYAAVKNTHQQHGQEAVWIDGWLHSRHRYSRFVRRRASVDEAAARLEQIVGLLPAYVELLGPFVGVRVVEAASRYQGRSVVAVALELDRGGKPDTSMATDAPARRWRRHVLVDELKGKALLDARTGVPLTAELKARWRFVPPARSEPTTGIPSTLAGDASRPATMQLAFEQRVSAVGKVASIAPPPPGEVLADPRRLRLDRERQFVTGERPMPGRWPRVAPLAEPDRSRR